MVTATFWILGFLVSPDIWLLSNWPIRVGSLLNKSSTFWRACFGSAVDFSGSYVWGQRGKWVLTVCPLIVSASACWGLLQFKSLVQHWANVSVLSFRRCATGKHIMYLARPFLTLAGIKGEIISMSVHLRHSFSYLVPFYWHISFLLWFLFPN